MRRFDRRSRSRAVELRVWTAIRVAEQTVRSPGRRSRCRSSNIASRTGSVRCVNIQLSYPDSLGYSDKVDYVFFGHCGTAFVSLE